MPSDKPQPHQLSAHHRSTAASVAARVVLVFIPLGAGLLLWLLVAALFSARAEGSSVDRLGSLIGLAGVGYAVMLATYAVSVILNPHPKDHALLIVGLSGAVVASGASVLALLAALVVALALTLWRQAMLQEAQSRIRFNFGRTTRASLGLTLALIALAIAVQSVTPAKLLNDPEAASQRLLDTVARGAERFVPILIQGVEPRRTLDDYLKEVASALEHGRSPLVPFPGLRVEGAPTAGALRQQLSENLGLHLTGRETLGDIIQQTVRDRLAPAVARAAGAIVPLFVLSLFLVLQVVNPVLGWLAVGLASLVFHGAKALGWVRIVREPVDVERIVVG